MPRSLQDHVTAGLLQRKPTDRQRVGRWLARSRKDLDLASNILASVDRDRAMAVAYEAGYRACAGILDLAGYRVTSQPGHHRAAIDGATWILGAEHRPLLRRLDRARRFRNEALYGDVASAGAAEFSQLLTDVAWLLDELASRTAEHIEPRLILPDEDAASVSPEIRETDAEVRRDSQR